MATIVNTIKWVSNMEQYRSEMEKGLSRTVAITQSAEKLAKTLSGDNLIRAAQNYVGAVEKLGGAEKLTNAERTRGNALLDKAIEKMRVMGTTAPDDMLRLAAATRAVHQPLVAAFFSDLGKQVVATAAGFISAQAVIGAVQRAFRTLKEFVSDSIQSFAAAEAAQTKLTTALRQQSLAVPSVIHHYNRLATEFQRTTVFSDDLVTEMQALLVQIGGVMPSKMRAALQASTDLAAGLGIDLRTATTLVAKAFAGKTETLGRYGIVVNETRLKAEGITAVLDQINQQFGGQATSQLDTYAGKTARLSNVWDDVKEAVGKVIVTHPVVEAGILSLSQALAQDADATEKVSFWTRTWDQVLWQLAPNVHNAAAAIKAAATEALVFADAERRISSHFNNYKKNFIDTRQATDLGAAGLVHFNEEVDRQAAALKRSKAAAEAAEKAYRTWADNATGAAVQRQVSELTNRIARLTTEGRMNATAIESVTNEALKLLNAGAQLTPQLFAMVVATGKLEPAAVRGSQAIENLTANAQKLRTETLLFPQDIEPAVTSMRHFWDDVLAFGTQLDPKNEILKTNDWKQGLGDISAAFAQLAQASGENMQQVARGLASLTSALNLANIAGKQIKEGGFANIVSGSLGAAGAFMQATNTGNKFINALGGMAVGAQVGSAIMPGLGTAIGAAAGAVGGFVRSLFGIKEGKRQLIAANAEIQKLRDNLIATHGDMATLQRWALIVGQDLQGAWGSQNVQGLRDFEALVREIEADHQLLNEAMQRYSISWEQLGQAARRAEIDKMALQLLNYHRVLVIAGADATLVLEKQADDWSKLTQAALRTGTEIPIAARPIIEQLAAMGRLVDENGVALTDLSGIQWAQTLTQGFDRVVAKLAELLDWFREKLPSAAAAGIGAITDRFDRFPRLRIPYEFVASGHVPGAFPELPEGSFHQGGIVEAQRYHRGAAHILSFHRAIRAHAGLAADEVPAILQVGESVLNRQATTNLGTDTIRALNRGGSPRSGGVVNLSALQRELKGLREDLKAQQLQAAADRRFMERTIPKAIKVAIQQGAA